jgi:putative transposase
MPEYRRIFIPGGTFFFTIVTYERQPLFFNPDTRQLFRKAVHAVLDTHPFCEVAYCILPDHIHTIWTLPEHDSDYPIRWRAIKGNFSRWYQELFGLLTVNNESHQKRGEATIWQRRYWEHLIRDDFDYENHMDYIHYNPVRHGLVTRPQDWKWSSFEDHVKNGTYEPDWGYEITPKFTVTSYGE